MLILLWVVNVHTTLSQLPRVRSHVVSISLLLLHRWAVQHAWQRAWRMRPPQSGGCCPPLCLRACCCLHWPAICPWPW